MDCLRTRERPAPPVNTSAGAVDGDGTGGRPGPRAGGTQRRLPWVGQRFRGIAEQAQALVQPRPYLTVSSAQAWWRPTSGQGVRVVANQVPRAR